MVGMLTSAVYFLSRDIERLSERVNDLEDDSIVLDDDYDEDEDEEPVTHEDVTKQE
jgi:hypothetical protein